MRTLLALFISILSISAYAFEPAPKLVINPVSVRAVSSHIRTPISIDISSSEGVKELRCYFKSSLDQQWFFTEAHFTGLNRFACEAPIFAEGLQWVDHRILVALNNDQVIRSTVFRLSVEASNAHSLFRVLPDQLVIFDELHGVYQPHIKDSNVVISALSDDRARFGYIAGLYSDAQIPHWLGAVAGYFGGLEYDPVERTVFPIKGYAPGLSDKGVDLRLSLPLFFATPSASIPNIDGNDWSGYFETTGFNNRQNLTSDVDQAGGNVTLTTSKSGLASLFIGTINSSGDMLVFDQSDGEDWTTHLGPANETSIGLYDFIRPPTAEDPNPPLNSVILSRVLIPVAPSSISASDGVFVDFINISWADVSNASYFLLYRCQTTSTASCDFIENTAALSTTDKPEDRQVYYYRVKACNGAGCSGYSASNSGYLAAVNIAGALMLLLLD